MNQPERLLARLDAIGQSLAQSGHALALIGLGSVGLEQDRLDDYSDLDFFVVVANGFKQRFIDTLDWLTSVCPVAFAFRNTVDGYKLLFADGIFCEFAVFEMDELATIPFAPGRIVWKQPQVDPAIRVPRRAEVPQPVQPREWLVGEALTNLYVGLGRYHRGERLSAARFIQHYAVDRVLELAAQLEAARPAHPDPFSGERRFEQRFPGVARELPQFIQGYERSRESAEAILGFLETYVTVDPAMATAIRALLVRHQ